MLLDIFKDGELVETMELSASKRVYKVGRQAGLADIVLAHGSISREQATLTVSASGSVVVADLGSAHGTLISGKKLAPNKPHLLPPSRSLTFGQSTRVFKLREGGTGFVEAGGSAAAATATLSAAMLLDDPRVQAALHVLRNGASDVERARPDGYLPLISVLQSSGVQRAGATEALLASLPAKLSETIEAMEDGGVLWLRALDGHAPSMRVDTKLVLTAIHSPTIADDEEEDAVVAGPMLPPSLQPAALPEDPNTLPSQLIFCASFKTWNALRSHGVGAGVEPPQPIRLCCQKPKAANTRVESLGNRAADLLVYVDTLVLLREGGKLFRVSKRQEVDAAEGESSGAGASAAAATPMRNDEIEPLACIGPDEKGGLIGPWLFTKVINARDGSEMMGEVELAPLREARRKAAEQVAVKAAEKAEAEQVRMRQREVSRIRREEAERVAERSKPVERYNPYLAHREGEDEEEEDEDA